MNRKFPLLVLFMLAMHLNGISQTITENEVDEFTGEHIRRTSWETLRLGLDFTAHVSLSQINNIKYLDLKLILGSGSVFAIDKGDALMFKLDNGEVLKFENIKYRITCKGCGATGLSGSSAQGLRATYIISEENAAMLKAHTVEKVRIYTTDGYVENKINLPKAESLKKAMWLIGPMLQTQND